MRQSAEQHPAVGEPERRGEHGQQRAGARGVRRRLGSDDALHLPGAESVAILGEPLRHAIGHERAGVAPPGTMPMKQPTAELRSDVSQYRGSSRQVSITALTLIRAFAPLNASPSRA